MFLQKKSFLTLLFLVTLIIPGLFSVQVMQVQAQSEETVGNVCPIQNALTARIDYDNEIIEVEEIIDLPIVVSNDSSYVLGGVRVGFAVFGSEDEKMPAFWTMLPETLRIASDQHLSIDSQVDVSALPSGEYWLKVYVSQGDELTLLGRMIHESAKGNSLQINKTSPADEVINTSITVNNNEASNISLNEFDSVDVVVNTQNVTEEILPKTSLIVAFIRGDIPLGSAVLKQQQDSVNPLPGKNRVTTLSERVLTTGHYSVVGGYLVPESLQPVLSTSITVGNPEDPYVAPFLSSVGLNATAGDEEVVACVSYFGADVEVGMLYDPVEIEFALSDEEGELVEFATTSEPASEDADYFLFSPKGSVNDRTLDVALYSLDQQNVVAENGEAAKVVAGVISQNNYCEDSSCRSFSENGSDIVVSEVLITEGVPSWHIWSFVTAGGLILLLIFLMLNRRQEAQEEKVNKEIEEGEEEIISDTDSGESK